MTLNIFVIKRWATLILAGSIPAIATVTAWIFYGFLAGIGAFLAGLLISVLFASLFLRTPFTLMQEGKGILCLNIDSTGVIMPFILKVQSPFMFGNVKGERIRDVFDRDAVHHLAVPKLAEVVAEGREDGGIRIDLTEDELNKGRFALFHYPVVIYNGQLRSIVTKDWLSEKEKNAFAEHGLLYMNRITEELTSYTRDFGRYVVEMLKPSKVFGGKWFWIILIGGLVILGALFLPSIISTIQSGGGTAVSAVTGSNSPIVPI